MPPLPPRRPLLQQGQLVHPVSVEQLALVLEQVQVLAERVAGSSLGHQQ
jgi:hypothetical protein